jgi:hypothetical protein
MASTCARFSSFWLPLIAPPSSSEQHRTFLVMGGNHAASADRAAAEMAMTVVQDILRPAGTMSFDDV